MHIVSKEEFDKFIERYPNELEASVCGIFEPIQIHYNDWKLGNWPESVVATRVVAEPGYCEAVYKIMGA